MRDYPHVNFSLDILNAAVTNYAHDPECEKGRGSYIVELINLSKHRQQLSNQVLHKLVAQKDNTYGLDQLFEIARLLAQAGHPEARVAFYERLELGALPEYACVGGYEAVTLDGVEGMKRAAAVIGQLLAANPDETEETWLLKHAQENSPEVQVEAELQKAAQHNEHIACYLAAVQETRQRKALTPPCPTLTFENIKQRIAQKTKCRLPESAVRKLSRKQIRQLADAFRVETNSARQGKYLQVFRHVKFRTAMSYCWHWRQSLCAATTGRCRMPFRPCSISKPPPSGNLPSRPWQPLPPPICTWTYCLTTTAQTTISSWRN